MIGFYNYSVIVTYIGVALSVSGMALASTGQFKFAILCLALAGACDTFDGKIARAMKNRTKEMEIFGIQIDSLCDMVCFGVTPVIISYQMGLNSVWGIAIEILFVLCGVIRLGRIKTYQSRNRPGKRLSWSANYNNYNYLSNCIFVSPIGQP